MRAPDVPHVKSKRPPSLSAFTDDQLQAELARRLRARSDDREREPLPWCYNCVRFLFWTETRDPPDDYNPCEKGHKMNFRMPADISEAHRGDYGHYLRRCADRVEREGVSHE